MREPAGRAGGEVFLLKKGKVDEDTGELKLPVTGHGESLKIEA